MVRLSSRTRSVLATLLLVQGALVTSAVVAGMRFQSINEHRALLTGVLIAVFVSAVGALWVPSHARRPLLRALPLLASAAVTARYWLPLFVKHGQTWTLTETRLVRDLRRLSLAQEEFRLGRGHYAAVLDSLREFTRDGVDLIPAEWSLKVMGDSGWSAAVRSGEARCEIRVRAAAGRFPSAGIEGLPSCGDAPVSLGDSIGSVAWVAGAAPFPTDAVTGEWLQHRARADRSGEIEASDIVGAPVWSSTVAGELRASASVAGGQVFVGAHGNGELVALHAGSGALGWRTRLPNWVHHEPIVAGDLLFVGFGNSEFGTRVKWLTVGEVVGSPPSGVVALERRTGLVRWLAPSEGSMMGAPAMSTAGLVSASVYGEVVMRAPADGAVRWRTSLPAGWHAPMTNPAVADSLIVMGGEPGRWCVLSVQDGARRFCRVERDVTLGFGHASPSVSDGIVVQSGVGDPDRVTRRRSKWRCTLFAFGCESEHGVEELAIVVASDLLTGRRRWATELRGTYRRTVGHIAGTAVIKGDLVVVPLPRIGEVVALALGDGAVRWRAPVRPARGSVSFLQRRIFAATMDADYVVLDPATGSVSCRAPLPAMSDRAGLAVRGLTGVLTLRNGAVLSAPVAEWMQCTAPFTVRP